MCNHSPLHLRSYIKLWCCSVQPLTTSPSLLHQTLVVLCATTHYPSTPAMSNSGAVMCNYSPLHLPSYIRFCFRIVRSVTQLFTFPPTSDSGVVVCNHSPLHLPSYIKLLCCSVQPLTTSPSLLHQTLVLYHTITHHLTFSPTSSWCCSVEPFTTQPFLLHQTLML